MSKKTEIPVYLVTGFLDSGKTSFLRSVLTPEGLADGQRTLLFICEEGEEELDAAALSKNNVILIPVEEYEDLTTDFLRQCQEKYRPQQVIFEYNGMWSMEELDQEILPENWMLYQIVHTVDTTTFDLYTKNMAMLMMEKLRNADMILFNRCTPEGEEYLRRRNLKMLNRRAQIYLEFTDGKSEDYDSGQPPFDMSGAVLDLADEDYGVWYVDVMEHPERYEGTLVRYRGMVAKSDKFPESSFVVGRFAMVCCADDTTFMGMICKTPEYGQYKNKDWVYVTSEVRVEQVKLYKGKGPILYTQKVERCQPPQEEIVNF